MTTPSTNSTPRQRRLPRRRPRAARGNAALPHRGSAPPASLSHGFRFQDFKTEVHETLPSFLELPIVEYRQSVRLDHGPDPLCPPHKTEIIGELQSLFVRHNAGAALSANAVFKPNKEFHIARHTLYSAEENIEIDGWRTRSGFGNAEAERLVKTLIPVCFAVVACGIDADVNPPPAFRVGGGDEKFILKPSEVWVSVGVMPIVLLDHFSIHRYRSALAVQGLV